MTMLKQILIFFDINNNVNIYCKLHENLIPLDENIAMLSFAGHAESLTHFFLTGFGSDVGGEISSYSCALY